MNTSVLFSSETFECGTPDDFFAEQDREHHFDIDVCGSAEYHTLPHYWNIADDCLTKDWGQMICWMNPIYGDAELACQTPCKKKRCPKRGYHIAEYRPGIADFLRKAHEACQKGAKVVCLLPARTDTGWYHDYCIQYRRRFLRGRLKFKMRDAAGLIVNANAPFPSVLVIMEPPVRSKYRWDEVAAGRVP